MTARPGDPSTLPFLAGGGEMGARMREKDWSGTALGPPESWPQSLRSTVSMLLPSKAQIILFWGPEFVCLYNDAYRPVFGAKHPDALGLAGSRAWHEIWDSQLHPLLQGVVTTGEAFWAQDLLFELERHGFPEETYFDVSYDPVRDESGAVGGVFCIVTETTERVVSQRRMALLRDLAARNAKARTMRDACALTMETLAGRPRDLTFALAYLDDELQSATPDAEALLSAANPDLVKTLPLPSSSTGGRAARLIVGINSKRPFDERYKSFLDLVTDQLATAIANARAYEEERQRVEALAALDASKTAFFSNVSHEFRTPLTLMLGPLEDLLAKPGDGRSPEDCESIQVIHRNGLRLLKLVNTLLEFSRIEAGRVQARFEAADLSAATTDLASTFRSAMDHAGLTFTIDCGALGAPVFVDRDMWEKIVLNLLSNAFKFTLTGGVTVRMRSTERHAVLEVQDTGVGIPAAELPRVFERFHRIESTSGRSYEGSGIGLALVHELVKLHGGDVTVESQAGAGTTFTVSIPFGSAHLPAQQLATGTDRERPSERRAFVEEALGWLRQDAQAAAPVRGEAIAATGHVLVADDNPDMLEYVRRLLSDRWTVSTARNGHEALSAARERRPDVIITDVMMPELDGFGLLRELRADPELQSIPIIMLSARAGEESRIEGVAAGADDYLVKPFSARDLMARVEAQFIKAQVRRVERQHARRLANLFTNAPVAIAILRGPDHVYELANAQYLESINGRDVVGKPVREAFPELEGQGIYDLLEGVRASGEAYLGKSLPVRLNRGPDGEPDEAFFDFVCQPTFDSNRQVESIVIVAHEVTELARAKAQADDANRLKDEFLATLSHELRTPLNAVLGYVQMLRGGLIEEDRLPDVLETIERNARMQEQLVNDVLDVSRIITGKLQLDVRPVGIAKVVEDAVQTVSPAAVAKGVKLKVLFEAADLSVAGDVQRLQQVVWNILSNAVKFTPRGGRVEVRLKQTAANVEIVVSDTGEGICPEFLPRMFQRFTQADGTFSRTHGGLGLGLAICRHIVEAHGGVISAVSPGRGKGATIRVELPILGLPGEQVQHELEYRTPRPVSDAPLPLTALPGLRVLLVDDDADALEMARTVLARAGALVTAASNANDALAALDQAEFDAGILDLGMPQVDGYELLRRIRSRSEDKQRRIPLAALSAYARPVDRDRSLQSGFQLHLTKPVIPSELTAAVLALRDDVTLPSE